MPRCRRAALEPASWLWLCRGVGEQRWSWPRLCRVAGEQRKDVSFDAASVVVLVVEHHGPAKVVDNELVEVPHEVLSGRAAAAAALIGGEVALEEPARQVRRGGE